MHPRNKMRLMAGLPIDHSLEITQITEARSVPTKKSELKPKTEESTKKHITGVTKAIAHLKNAVKALERIPATDFNGEVPYYINHIEEILGDDGMKKYISELQSTLTEGSAFPGCEECGDDDSYTGCKTCADKKKKNKTMKDVSESTDLLADEKEQKKEMGIKVKFSQGEPVFYEKKGFTGIWIVHMTDPEAESVGIVVPSMMSASKEEKDKAMMTVSVDDCRKPTEEENRLMAGPDGKMGTADDANPAERSQGMHESVGQRKKEEADMIARAKKKSAEILGNMENKRQSVQRVEAMKKKNVKESTLNYTQSNAQSYEDEESDPANVVGQAEKQWANSLDPQMVKNEYTSQLDDKGAQSMDDEANKVKVPAKLKTAMKDAINAFINDAERIPSSGHTAAEKKQFMLDTAEAFQEILDHLNGGTIMDIKKAQIFTSSLMGPMLHKLPDGVWDFITNGGQKRSLRNFMNEVK